MCFLITHARASLRAEVLVPTFHLLEKVNLLSIGYVFLLTHRIFKNPHLRAFFHCFLERGEGEREVPM